MVNTNSGKYTAQEGSGAMKVLCVGLTVCDLLAKPVDINIMRMDSCRVQSMLTSPGGDALNVACSLARLGFQTVLVGKIGKDAFGTFLRKKIAEAHVEDALIVDPDHGTAVSIVLIEQSGERHFAYYGKCNDTLRETDVSDACMEGVRHLHVGSAMALAALDGDGLSELLKRAKDKGLTTSLDCTYDAEEVWYPKVEKALRVVDYFLPSFEEASRIAGTESLDEMVRFYRQAGVGHLVVKLGRDGCFVTDFERSAVIPAFAVERVVDTTGAGDTFVAGFLSGLLEGRLLPDCALRGNAYAAQTVQTLGTQVRTAKPSMLDQLKYEGGQWL